MLSCNKTVLIELEDHQPRLVLHGYIATGELFSVAIGKSARLNTILNSDETFVDNAWALLYENDVFRDSLKYDAQQKRYVTQNVVAVSGRTYKIVAGASGFANIESVARATLPVNTISFNHDKNARTTSSGVSMDEVTFSLQDPPGEKNYYMGALYPSWLSGIGFVCVYSSDPAIERVRSETIPFEEGNCIDRDQIIFSDKSFNGSVKQMTISTESIVLETKTDNMGNLHRPYMKRLVLSEDYYKYLKATIAMFNSSSYSSISQPVAVKGNVKNGYGLLAVYSVTTDTLR